MITLSKQEIQRLPMLVGGDKGQYGTCYYYNGLVIKLSKTTAIALSKRKLIMRNIHDLLGTKIEDISLPIDITPDSVRYFAYSMSMIDGPSFIDVRNGLVCGKEDLLLENLSLNYKNGKNKIYQLTDKSIEIHDMKATDCKFKEDNKFGICDVDGFIKNHYSDYNDLISHNMLVLNEVYAAFLDLLVLDLGITVPLADESKYYVDDILGMIVKNTNSSVKTFGEFIKK